MGAHVCRILAQSEEQLYIKSGEDEETDEEEDDFCDCPPLRRPVCGSDRNTYSSECNFKCASDKDPTLKIERVGSCSDNKYDNVRWWLLNQQTQ